MTDLSSAEICFLTARENVKRGCVEKWQKSHPDLPPSAFSAQPLLLAPELRQLSWNALAQARGRLISGDALFTATIWIECFDKQKQVLLKGAQATMGGYAFRRSLHDFIKLLHERAACVAPKRQGWVIEPTTNLDGHRTNLSTVAMHALFLDCDGAGEWTTLLDGLTQLDLCFIAYQSGGWTPTTPKWRVVLPLTTPFSTTTESARDAWKTAYHHARVVFGSLAYLTGQGFDPATDTPACPWFLTERRDEKDPPRQIVHRFGHTLDLMSLMMALPAVDEDATTPGTTRPRVEGQEGLSDERLDEIIRALAAVTNHIPSGRHDLYLALPGVMLDRGISPDDVLAIIEGVSSSYPRKHADKHKDNIHNAKTTISRWQSGHNVTRIGTVQERWPDIAAVLDNVVPAPATRAMVEATAAMFAPSAPVAVPAAAPTASSPTPAPKKTRRAHKLNPFAHEVLEEIRKLDKSEKQDDKITAMLFRRIVDNEPFIAETPEQIAQCVNLAMLKLGYHFPTKTWVQVTDLAHMTLHMMDFTQSIEKMNVAEQAFLEGQKERRKFNSKRHVKVQQKLAKGRDLLAEADRLEAAQRHNK